MEFDGDTDRPTQQPIQRTAPLLTVKRKPVKQLRKEWEKGTGQPWPKTREGRNLDADHDQPLADGGKDDWQNVTPRTNPEHTQRHVNNGDFRRWAARGRGGIPFGGQTPPPNLNKSQEQLKQVGVVVVGGLWVGACILFAVDTGGVSLFGLAAVGA